MYRHFVDVFIAAIAFLANWKFLSGNRSAKTDRWSIRAKGVGEDFLYILEDNTFCTRRIPTYVSLSYCYKLVSPTNAVFI